MDEISPRTVEQMSESPSDPAVVAEMLRRLGTATERHTLAVVACELLRLAEALDSGEAASSADFGEGYRAALGAAAARLRQIEEGATFTDIVARPVEPIDSSPQQI